MPSPSLLRIVSCGFSFISAAASPSGVCSGNTEAGNTNWVRENDDGIYTVVDTSSCGFTARPIYISSMVGDSSHSVSTGSSEIYEAQATHFTVYISHTGITPEKANRWNWRINWIGDGTGAGVTTESVCAGQQQQDTVAWTQNGANDIYVHVDTSNCGFEETPRYFSSLGGRTDHWTSKGSSEIYSPTANSFLIYINADSITPEKANTHGWHMNWVGYGAPKQSKATAPCSGLTPYSTTNWQAYYENIKLEVDTSSCGFTSTPIYVSSMHGYTSHWTTRGSSEIYSPTATSFLLHIWASGGTTPAKANEYAWHIAWMATPAAPTDAATNSPTPAPTPNPTPNPTQSKAEKKAAKAAKKAKKQKERKEAREAKKAKKQKERKEAREEKKAKKKEERTKAREARKAKKQKERTKAREDRKASKKKERREAREARKAKKQKERREARAARKAAKKNSKKGKKGKSAER